MRRLKTASDVRRYLAFLVNSVECGTMPADKASKLTYVCNVLLKACALTWEQNEMLAIEERLNEIEDKLQCQDF